MELREITTDVWTFEFGLRLGPGIHFPTRSTILKVSDDRALVISPGPFDEEAKAAIDQIAKEKWIVAPNMVHHLYFGAALDQFSPAVGWAPAKLWKKNGSLQNRYRDIAELSSACPDVDTIYLEGNKFLGETVFLHKPSNTLVLTDFAFHMRGPYQGLTGVVLRIVGCHNRLGQSRLVSWTTKDRQAFRRSSARLQEWQPDRVIVGHGDVITNPGEVWEPFLKTVV